MSITVEHKSFTAPTYALVLTSLQAYLNNFSKRKLVSVQERNVDTRQVTETTYEYFGTYFIVWSS